MSSARSNCKRCTKATPRQLRAIELAVRRSPTKSSLKLQQELQSIGLNLGASTLRRYLKNMGLFSRFAVKKPLLTKRHKRLRLQFAKKYVKMDANFWRHVLFTDETKIATCNDSQRLRIRRKIGEQFNIITPCVKYPMSVMLWGSFAANGVGQIRFLEKGETCNSAWYLKVLDKQVKSSAKFLFQESEFYLQDDGAPCHRSKIVKEFITKQQWKTLDWPPQSPDLNPIENLWFLLKMIWKQPVTNVTSLRARIIFVWYHNIDSGLLERLALSMSDRLRAVIKARGGPTKY